MSREIKFRAWCGTHKYMTIDIQMMQDTIGNASFYLGDLQDGVAITEEQDWAIMQFTGLIDKNGKEIYEGDILSHQKRMYEVAINFNGYYLQRYKLWNGKFKPSFHYAMSLITKPFEKGERGEDGGIVDCAEIVGNIHENQELCKPN